MPPSPTVVEGSTSDASTGGVGSDTMLLETSGAGSETEVDHDGSDGSVDPCLDGVKNGTESDVDCGGTDCAPCPLQSVCRTGDDCDAGLCVRDVCAPPEASCVSKPCGAGLVCVGTVCLGESSGPFQVVASAGENLVQYDLLTSQLYVVGSSSRFMSYLPDFWYLDVQTDLALGSLLWVLLKSNSSSSADQAAAIEAGWGHKQFEGSNFKMMRLSHLENQITAANHNGDTTPSPDHYTAIPTADLFSVLYGNTDHGEVYLAVGAPSVRQAAGFEPVGDLFGNGGLRVDVAFKATVVLEPEEIDSLRRSFGQGTHGLDDRSVSKD